VEIVSAFPAIPVEKASFDGQANAGRRRLHTEHCMMKDFILQANGATHFLLSDAELSDLCSQHFDEVIGDCLVNENDMLKFGFTKEKMSDAVRARFISKEHCFPLKEEGGDDFRTHLCPRSKLRAGGIGERGGIPLHRAVTSGERFCEYQTRHYPCNLLKRSVSVSPVKVPANCDRSA
jgi:hypothetical protein